MAVNREMRELNSQITSDFNEGIAGAKTIKTLVIEDKIYKSFRKDTQAMRHKSVRAAHLRGLFAATMNLASSAGAGDRSVARRLYRAKAKWARSRCS